MMDNVKTERVKMGDLQAGDIVWSYGMRIRLSGGVQHEPRERYNDTISWFHGEIINDYHPYNWAERTWTVQSADWVGWDREVPS
jgi:hypothetical protein